MQKSNKKIYSVHNFFQYIVVDNYFSRSGIYRLVKSVPIILGLAVLLIMPLAWGQKPETVEPKRAKAAIEKKYEIRLPTRTFIPKAAVPADLDKRLRQLIEITPNKKAHLIVQLENPPGASIRKQLARQGVTLLESINRYTWRASVNANGALMIGRIKGVRWANVITAEDKLAKGAQLTDEPFPYQLRPSGRIAYSVLFHKDVEAEEVLSLSRRIDAELENFDAKAFSIVRSVIVTVPPGGIEPLADADIVAWIEPARPPYADDNLMNAQPLSNVNVVQGVAPDGTVFNLDGTGVTVGVWESGDTIYDAHLDLTPRVDVEAGQTADNDDHAAHVAGSIGASGVNVPNAEGMAPNVNITSWDTTNDINEITSAATSTGAPGQPTPIQISNHSYSLDGMGWNGAGTNFNNNQDLFGLYTNDSQAYDSIVHQTGLIMIKTAGNERGAAWDSATAIPGVVTPPVPPNPPPPPGDCLQGGLGVDADCIGPFGSSKNVITVGAMTGAAGIANFSSYGPTDDGRIKPDVMAHGWWLTSLACNCFDDRNRDGIDDVPNSNIASRQLPGTSMSSAVVSGITALVLQDANDHNLPMTPAGMKALLIQTAQDVQGVGQSNIGPDYATGWGIADAEAAIRLLRQGGLTQGTVYTPDFAVRTRPFSVPAGTADVRITLAWADPPGTVGGQILKNDLDLRLISPNGTVFTPWILDPLNPGNAATVNGGNDDVNNVEQVLVRNTMPGFMPGIWTARVSAEPDNFLEPPQEFALAGPLGLTIVEPTELRPAWAGTSTDGRRVMIRFVASSGLDTSLGNLLVTVDGTTLTPDQIAIHSIVDYETWLVISPGAKSEGCYDLTITLSDMPDVTDTALQSLCYENVENRTVDRVVAVDRTNSMIWNTITHSDDEEKMESAREAARTYVDLSEDTDMIGVVSFQCHDENGNGDIEEDELSEPEFSLTLANDGGVDRRPDGRATITALSPRTNTCGVETSLGAGLLEAKAMLDTDGRADSAKSIILVTDGLENYAPYWSQGENQLRPEFSVGDIRVDAISIGLDADDDILLDIAESTGGNFENEAEGMGSLSLLSRLSNTFKSIDEDIRGEQRFYYQEGLPPRIEKHGPEFSEWREGSFTVEPNLDWMTVTFHWSRIETVSILHLFSPDGTEINTTRKDSKHSVYKISRPLEGVWCYEVLVPFTSVSDEFFATASGPTLLTASLRIGQPRLEEDGRWSTPVRVWIAETDATTGAVVTATVRRPDKHKLYPDLLDAGTTSDGAINDGVYATVIEDALPGPYHVDAVARSISAAGEPFERYMSGTFLIPGREKPPAQLGEGQPTFPGGILGEICAKKPWCCWLWLAFIIALAATLVALARFWCCMRG